MAVPTTGRKTKMNSNGSMGLQSVVEHLEKHSLKHAVDLEAGLVRTSFEMTNVKFSCLIEANDQDDLVQFTAMIPLQVPCGKRRDACELLALINWRLALGQFQMDLGDGELRFQASVPYPQGELADAVIRQLVIRCAFPVNVFYPAIAGVAFGGKSPEAAFDAAIARAQSAAEGEGAAVADKPRVELN